MATERREFIKNVDAVDKAEEKHTKSSVKSSGKLVKKSDLSQFKNVKLSQKHEFLPLRAVIIANPFDCYAHPYNESTKAYTEHLPEPFKNAIINSGSDKPVLLKDLMPEWQDAIEKSTDELEKVYKKHGVLVYRSYEVSPEIKNYIGYMEAGYWSYGVADAWKVMGDTMVELSNSDNIRSIAPQVFEYRDLIWKAFKNTPGSSWVSMPPAAPSDPDVDPGLGPFVVGAEIKILDEKNILVGCGVEKEEDIKKPNYRRSASNEDGIKVFKAFAEKLGYTVHQSYYDSNVSFHMDTIFGLVKPGVVAFPKKAMFHVPKYVKDNFQIIDIPLDECAKHLTGNMVNINEKTIVINSNAKKTIKILEDFGMNVEAIDYWAGAELGTGPWCSTCAIWRE